MKISTNTLARLTGVTYLLLILTGVYGLVYVPSLLFDWDSPAATVKNILENEFTFRLAVTSEILCFIFFIFLPLLFFQLFHKVDRHLSVIMVALAVLSVPVTIAHVAKHVDVLTIIKGQSYLNGMSQEWLNGYVMLCLAGFNNGVVVSNIFWGLWLLPLGLLVYKSKFLPKLIGVFLMLGCLGYLMEFICKFIFTVPEVPWYVSAPSSLGEFGICLWLIFLGARPSVRKVKSGLSEAAA